MYSGKSIASTGGQNVNDINNSHENLKIFTRRESNINYKAAAAAAVQHVQGSVAAGGGGDGAGETHW